MLILIINALAYILWFSLVLLREKTLTLYSIMIAVIALISVMGVYTIANGIWFDTFGYFDLDSISIFPYILTFIAFVMLFSPLKGVDNRIVFSTDVFESSLFKYILLFWLILIGVYTLVRLSEMFVAISIGLNEVYKDRHVLGNDLLFMQYANPLVGKLIWLSGMISSAMSPIMLYYSSFLISREKILLPLIILILAVLPDIVYAVALGSRGSMVWGLFKLIFIFILTKGYMSKEIKKKVISVMLSLVLLVLINAAITTIGRVEDSKTEDGAVSSVLRYFGEPFPNAGLLYWDNVKVHPMGDRFFPDYVGFNKDIGTSSDEKFNYWGEITGVPILNWKIFYIDCYIEFGVLGGLFFVAFISIIFGLFFRNRDITVYNISILYAYFTICDSSFTGYNMFSQNLNVTIISIVIVNYVMFLISKKDISDSDADESLPTNMDEDIVSSSVPH